MAAAVGGLGLLGASGWLTDSQAGAWSTSIDAPVFSRRNIYSRIRLPPARVLALLREIATLPPLPQPILLAQARDTVRLGARRVDVPLTISPEGRRALAALGADRREGANVDLVLEGIRVEGQPAVFYEIYINLPPDQRNPSYTSTHYVGNLDLFGPSPEGRHAGMHEPQIVPLTLAYLQLREDRRWTDEIVRITFLPRGVTEGEDPLRILGKHRSGHDRAY